ncbi:hypothetical protein ACLMJK_001427 [Lecanora helva]
MPLPPPTFHCLVLALALSILMLSQLTLAAAMPVPVLGAKDPPIIVANPNALGDAWRKGIEWVSHW